MNKNIQCLEKQTPCDVDNKRLLIDLTVSESPGTSYCIEIHFSVLITYIYYSP